MSTEPSPASIRPADLAALWAGILAGPIAWFAHQRLAYALCSHACAVRGRSSLHLATIACLVFAAAGATLSWRLWKSTGLAFPSDTDEGTLPRDRLMAAEGLFGCLLSAWVILAQWLAVFLLSPCIP